MRLSISHQRSASQLSEEGSPSKSLTPHEPRCAAVGCCMLYTRLLHEMLWQVGGLQQPNSKVLLSNCPAPHMHLYCPCCLQVYHI